MIIIAWQTSTTTTAEDGGDTVTRTYGSITVDGAEREIHEQRAEATEDPVAAGVNITDHVRPMLGTKSLECAVASHPLRDGGRGVALPEGADDFEPNPITGEDRPREVVEQLEELARTGTPVDVYGLRFGPLEGWLILGVAPTVEPRGGEGVRFVLDLRELRTAELRTTDAPSPRVERGRRRRDRGRQGSGDGDDAASSRPRSILRGLYDRGVDANPNSSNWVALPTVGGSS